MGTDRAGGDPTPRAGDGGPYRKTPTQLATDPAFTGTYASRWRQADLIRPGQAFTRVSDNPPTVTFSALNGATAVASGVDVAVTDATKVQLRGVPFVKTGGGGGAAQYIGNAGSDAQDTAFQVAFVTDAAYLEFSYLGSAAPQYRLWVDGRRVTADLVTGSATGGGRFRMQITFPDRRMREIVVDCYTMYPSFITVAPTDTLYPPPQPATVAAVMGDSYSQQVGPDNWFGVASRLLGWSPVMAAAGGTGYTVAASYATFASRLAAYVLAAAPDVMVFAGGINDPGTGLQAAATSLFATAHAAYPAALMVAVGPWQNSTGSAISQASKGTAIAAAAATVPGMIYVDNLTSPWITGSGAVATPAGDGNADNYMPLTSDVHPNPAGQAYLGARFAAAVRSALARR